MGTAFPVLFGRRAALAPQFYVNAASGNDSNSGRSSSAAWLTWGKVAAAIGNGTIPANGIIIILTAGGPLQFTGSPVALGGRSIFSDIPGTRAKVLFNNVLPGTGWTNPSGHIHKLAAGATTRKHATVRYNNAGTMTMFATPVIAANAAAAQADLETYAGSYYADPTNGDLYVHTPTGSNPNSDGVTYDYGPDYNNGSDCLLIDASGGVLKDIWFDGGGTLDPTQGTTGNATNPITQAVGADDLDKHSSLVHLLITGYTKHGFETAANDEMGGSYSVVNCTAGVPPAGFFQGSYSGFVTYCSVAAGGGTATTLHSGCVDNGSGFTTHNNSAGINQFLTQMFINNNFSGSVGLGALETKNVVSTGNLFGGEVSMQAATTTSTNDTFTARLPLLGGGGGTITNATFAPGTAFTDTPYALSGTWTITNSNFYLAASNIYCSAWSRGGVFHLTISGGNIYAWYNTSYGLIQAMTTGTDTLLLTGVNILAAGPWPLIESLNAGAAQTYAAAVTAGVVTGCTFLDLWQFDANNSLLYQDSGLTTPAVANGDPVAVALDVRDTSAKRMFYRACANVTLSVVAGRKSLVFNGTSSTADMKAGAGVEVDLGVGAQAVSIALAVRPLAFVSYSPAFMTTLGAGGARLCLQTSSVTWGTYGGPDQNAGTTLAINTNYVLEMAVAAGNSGVFYTNGVADGTFAATVGDSADSAYNPQIGHESTARYANMRLSGERIAGGQDTSGQAATRNTALQATF